MNNNHDISTQFSTENQIFEVILKNVFCVNFFFLKFVFAENFLFPVFSFPKWLPDKITTSQHASECSLLFTDDTVVLVLITSICLTYIYIYHDIRVVFPLLQWLGDIKVCARSKCNHIEINIHVFVSSVCTRIVFWSIIIESFDAGGYESA